MKEFKKNLSSNRAITLIALIITIIIMLILVGVSISLVIQSDLIGVAQDAADSTKTKYQEEASMSGVTIDGVEYDSIEDYIAAIQGGNTPVTPPPADEPVEGINIKLSMVSTEVPVTADGTYVDKIKEGVPIPEGFYYVGGTKNTGVVISDAAADENTTNTTVAENLTGNQYVWVPVVQNQKLKIEVASEAEITEITIGGPSSMITTDKNGTTISPSGTSYTVEVNPTMNGVYVVTAKAGEELAATELITVSSLYAQDYYLAKEFLGALEQLEEIATEYEMTVDELIESGALESEFPGLSQVAEAPSYLNEILGGSEEEDPNILIHKESVNTYGGFYIARYEAGSENNRYSDKSSSTVYSQRNKYPFNYVTQAEAVTLSQAVDTGKSSVTSDLTNAAAFDRTLNWLVETNAITVNDTINELEDSRNWGNYYDSEFNFIGKCSIDGGQTYIDTTTSTKKQTYADSSKIYLLGTGVSDYTKRNNIYDLAGNYEEWSTEFWDTDYVDHVARDMGTFSPDGGVRAKGMFYRGSATRSCRWRSNHLLPSNIIH